MNNRQLKFRVWDTDSNEWYGSSRFTLLNDDGILYNDLSFSLGGNPPKEVKNCIIQESTGLLDAFDVEIYEGDLLLKRSFDGVEDIEGTVEIYEVRYNPKVAAFQMFSLEFCNCDFQFQGLPFGGDGSDLQVIGNIFENNL